MKTPNPIEIEQALRAPPPQPPFPPIDQHAVWATVRTYPAEAGLQSLRRQLTLHREAPHGWIEVADHFAFAAGATPFESAVTTFNEGAVGENAVLIYGLHGEVRIGFDPETVDVQVERHEAADFAHGQWRRTGLCLWCGSRCSKG